MAIKDVTDVSQDHVITQTITWDTETGELEIVHLFHINAGEGILFQEVNTGQEPEGGYVTTFRYKRTSSESEVSRTLRFPSQESLYPAAGLPHNVHVELYDKEGGTVSSAVGSVIPD